MRSLFIGFALFLAFVPFAPLTMLWVLGERYQGRIGIDLDDESSEAMPSGKGFCLIVCTVVFSIFWTFAIAKACR